ncbi:MAG: NAD(P)/FAD-dependent oxidoreductase [Bacillota bacterium]
MKRVIVIGGGAAGMMAACIAAENGAAVVLLEKNAIIGKKLLITGKGRCNITNDCTRDEFIKNTPGNGRFMHSAFSMFDNRALMDFFESRGLKLKVERGGRVFPDNDEALSVVQVFKVALETAAVEVVTNCEVRKITKMAENITVESSRGQYLANAVVIATGGMSYPLTGSTGAGWKFASELGLTVIEPRASLVPLESADNWLREVQGLSLRNVKATLIYNEKVIAEEFGELLFTHFGLSGPTILTLSRELVGKTITPGAVRLEINLKPALTMEILDARLMRDFAKNSRKMLKNGFAELLPLSLINPFLSLLSVSANKQLAQLTKAERQQILDLLQKFPVNINGVRPIAEAIVTAGGVSVKELNPKTMECKTIANVYFAGETIDVDAYTGGFNLQIAFSSGYAAGMAAGKCEK